MTGEMERSEWNISSWGSHGSTSTNTGNRSGFDRFSAGTNAEITPEEALRRQQEALVQDGATTAAASTPTAGKGSRLAPTVSSVGGEQSHMPAQTANGGSDASPAA
ncbi:hypothetical protein I316_02859 [Kwoniella heveanensis BCC8398]|uniref:Uncharacterized protein n=1 Tax=Kwoniella heveanensis BCC8398 TaxID=1296120 RepID=A0A1B9GWA4_9TREE|nr:hypothetical protein I316_02859 [Kwoniella heveanensis BCC8398]